MVAVGVIERGATGGLVAGPGLPIEREFSKLWICLSAIASGGSKFCRIGPIFGTVVATIVA